MTWYKICFTVDGQSYIWYRTGPDLEKARLEIARIAGGKLEAINHEPVKGDWRDAK